MTTKDSRRRLLASWFVPFVRMCCHQMDSPIALHMWKPLPLISFFFFLGVNLLSGGEKVILYLLQYEKSPIQFKTNYELNKLIYKLRAVSLIDFTAIIKKDKSWSYEKRAPRLSSFNLCLLSIAVNLPVCESALDPELACFCSVGESRVINLNWIHQIDSLRQII